jgi:hypothetical protein
VGFDYKYDETNNVLVVRMWGDLQYSEEAEAVSHVFDMESIKTDVKILVDRRRARFKSETKDVLEHVRLVAEKVKRLGKPVVANVVSADYDFGMARMFELHSEGRIDHDFQVFKNLAEACAWLGIDSADLEWLNGDPESLGDRNDS